MQKQYIKGLVTKSGEGKYKVLASTSAIDRMGDSIDQAGWDLVNFKLNPVMPWAHDYSELPVAKVISIEVTDKGLEAEFEFAPAEGNPKAQQIKVLYDEGYLNAVSVGFIPKERNGNVITRSELLEISFVPVPANQEALKLAIKSLDVSLVPEVTEAVEKGEVADELDAEEILEEKYKKWSEVCEILSAFWSVYFDENTPLEDFGKLLTETVGLLQELAGTDGADDDAKALIKGAMNPASVKSFTEAMAKTGRTLSKKTLENIDKAIISMKDATSVLEELKTASSEDQDGKGDAATGSEEKEIITGEENEEAIELSFEDVANYLRRTTVANDKQNEATLSLLNAFLKKQKQ